MYIKLYDEIKNLIEKINDTPGEYGKNIKDIINIKFNSNDNFPLNKILNRYEFTEVINGRQPILSVLFFWMNVMNYNVI